MANAAENLDNTLASVVVNIKQLGEQVNQRFDRLEAEVTQVKGELKQLNEKVENLRVDIASVGGELKQMDSRLGQVEGRLNNQTNWFITILAILVTGLLGILSKFAFFQNV
ncbi:MAG: hypothetical protein QNJ54_37640 [Prochloraceae cyanobacterium]|nr:hypothetical protein [Prochloraceae cyanobacterium]